MSAPIVAAAEALPESRQVHESMPTSPILSLGAQFDTLIPEGCDLPALRVRHKIASLLSGNQKHLVTIVGSPEEVPTDKVAVQSRTVTGLTHNNRDLSAAAYIREVSEEVTEIIPGGIFKKDQEVTKKEFYFPDPNKEAFELGIAIEGRFTRKTQIYPLLLYILTSQGCGFVLPNGEKLEPEKFNIPGVVQGLDTVFRGGDVKEIDQAFRNVIELVGKTAVLDQLASIPEGWSRERLTDVLFTHKKTQAYIGKTGGKYALRTGHEVNAKGYDKLLLGVCNIQKPGKGEPIASKWGIGINSTSKPDKLVLDVFFMPNKDVYGTHANLQLEVLGYRIELDDDFCEKIYAVDINSLRDADDKERAFLKSLFDGYAEAASKDSRW